MGRGQARDDGSWNSSLLPEPVAPTTRPCGPIPPSAASLRSRTSGLGQVDADRHVEELSSGTHWQPSSPWGPTAPSGPGLGGQQVEETDGPGSRSHWRRAVEPRGARRRVMVSQVAMLAESADAGHPAPAGNGLQECREPLVVDADAHRQLGRLVGGGRGQPDDGHTGRGDTATAIAVLSGLAGVGDRPASVVSRIASRRGRAPPGGPGCR